MLYNIVDWDSKTGIAQGYKASIPFVQIKDVDIVYLYSEKQLENTTYSFNCQRKFIDGFYVFGELDYQNPVPTGRKVNKNVRN